MRSFMKHFKITRTLFRGCLWRMLPLFFLMYMMGFQGVFSWQTVYSFLLPAKVFKSRAVEEANLRYVHMPDLLKNAEGVNAYADYRAALQSHPEIERLYFSLPLLVQVEGFSEPLSLQAFSEDLIDLFNLPLEETLRKEAWRADAVPLFVSYRSREAFSPGDMFSLSLLSLHREPLFLNAQVVGYLPKSGFTPMADGGVSPLMPSWESLYRLHTETEDQPKAVFLCPLERLAAQLPASFPAPSAYQAAPFERALPAPRVIALSLSKQVSWEEEMALRRELFQNGQGSWLSPKEIASSDLAANFQVYKRSLLNTGLYFFITILATAGIIATLVFQAERRMRVLRILGMSWRSVLAHLFFASILLCLFFALLGALNNDLSHTNDETVVLMLRQAPSLRYLSLALLTALMSLEGLIAYLFLRKRDPMQR